MKMMLFLMAFIDLLSSRSVENASSGSQFEGQPFNSFLTRDVTCLLMITYVNSLDPDQDRQNVGPDLDPNHLTL